MGLHKGILAAMVGWFGFAAPLYAAPQSPADVAVIGFIAPLSGPRASIGEDARAAAELALEELNRENPRGPNFTLRFEDSQGDPAKGVAAFQRLAAAGASAVITQNSNVSLPISPVANRLGIVQLAITTTSDRFTTPKDYVFRLNGPTLGEARLMADVLDVNTETIGIVTMQDEYPEVLRQHLLDQLKSRNIRPVADEKFLPSENDFRALLVRFSRAKAAKVICLGYQTQCGLFVKQMREVGLNPALTLVNTPVNNREFFTVAGAAAEGVLVTYPAPVPGSMVSKRFFERTGRELNFFSSNAYDSVRIIAIAVKGCGDAVDGACLASELYKVGDFDGASGRKRFDANGDMQDTYRLLVARGGKFAEPTPVAVAKASF